MHLIVPSATSHAFTGPEVWAGLQLTQFQTLLSLLKRQERPQDPRNSSKGIFLIKHGPLLRPIDRAR
jgi:hypothetical protein